MPIRVLDEREGIPIPMISRRAFMVLGPHVGAKTATMSLVRLERGEANHPHVHVESEDTIFVLEGNGIVTDFDNNKNYPIQAGSVVLIPPGLRHTVQGAEPNGMWSVGGPVPPDREMLRKMGLDL